ncbi:Tex-like N-terminal domain-containing protein [Escherichia coli]
MPFAGSTKGSVPFIARYRKEITGGLDDTQPRVMECVWDTCASWKRDVRRSSSPFPSKANSPAASGECHQRHRSKTELEDLYLPYKPDAAPAGKSPLKQGLSRWLTCCGSDRRHMRSRRCTIC